jgi:hypothetical protein
LKKIEMANPDDIILEWHGPYNWFGEEAASVFAGESAESSGIYVWTVPVYGPYRIFYVGQTGKGLATRHHDHFREYFGDAYSIYAPDAFAAGRLELLYKGYAYRTPRWRQALPFHERFVELVETGLDSQRISHHFATRE